MKLILAQGNPGAEYRFTRHNIGFSLLNNYANHVDASFTEKSKFFASVAEFTKDEEKILLVKPTTFYNETGKSARAIVDFYKLVPAQDVLVLHDDISLPIGTVRTRERGSDAGNNGIKSLNAHLGTDYKRIRVGIWNELLTHIDATKFVLGTFSGEERKILADKQSTVFHIIDTFLLDTFTVTSYK